MLAARPGPPPAPRYSWSTPRCQPVSKRPGRRGSAGFFVGLPEPEWHAHSLLHLISSTVVLTDDSSSSDVLTATSLSSKISAPDGPVARTHLEAAQTTSGFRSFFERARDRHTAHLQHGAGALWPATNSPRISWFAGRDAWLVLTDGTGKFFGHLGTGHRCGGPYLRGCGNGIGAGSIF